MDSLTFNNASHPLDSAKQIPQRIRFQEKKTLQQKLELSEIKFSKNYEA